MKMRVFVLTLLGSLLALTVGLPSASLPPHTIVRTIAFGSCSKSHLAQPLWPVSAGTHAHAHAHAKTR